MIPNEKCFKFCMKIGIGWLNPPISKDNPLDRESIFSTDDIKKLISLNSVFVAQNGGLILGNLHSQGGIHMLKAKEKDKFEYVGEMEGWEYLTLPLMKDEFKIKFENINSITKNVEQHIKTDFDVPDNCKIIDTSNVRIPFLILSPFLQFIINRAATKKHIKEIIKLDKEIESNEVPDI